MIHFPNTLVFFKLVLFFQCIKPIYILLGGTMGLPHIHQTIVYTTNDTALKNKRKSNDAIYLITGVRRKVQPLFMRSPPKNFFNKT